MKKIILILLITAMCTAVLIACSSNEIKENDETASSNNISSETESEETSVQKSEFEPAANTNYDGYDFTFLCFDSTPGSWKIVSYSEIMAEESNGDPINDAIYTRNMMVEELYNINIDIFPVLFGDRETMGTKALNAILSGDDVFDTALMVGVGLPVLLKHPDALISLDSIENLDLTKSWWDQRSVDELSIGKKSYLVVGDINLYASAAVQIIFGNKNLIKNFSLDDPYKLVLDGKWTWDELHEMGKTVAADTDGNGIMNEKDRYGLIDISVTNAIVTSGERYASKNNDDLPSLTFMNERSVAIVDKMLDIINDSETFLNTSTVKGYSNVFREYAMPKFQRDETLFFYTSLRISLDFRDMDGDFAILPVPKFDEAQENYYTFGNKWSVTYTCIPQTNTDLERTANILQAMGYYSKEYVTPSFYDVTVTNKIIRDEESVGMLDILLKNRVYDIGMVFDWGEMTSMLDIILTQKTNTFTSIYESKKTVIETEMEKTLEAMGVK